VSIERIDLRVDLERLAARLTTKQRVPLADALAEAVA